MVRAAPVCATPEGRPAKARPGRGARRLPEGPRSVRSVAVMEASRVVGRVAATADEAGAQLLATSMAHEETVWGVRPGRVVDREERALGEATADTARGKARAKSLARHGHPLPKVEKPE